MRTKAPSRPPTFGSRPKITLRTMVYVFSFIKKMKKSLKSSKYRSHILHEWLTTQYSYCRDLNIALNHIKKPMQENKMIDESSVNILFPQFEGMIKLSKMMSSVLEKAKKRLNPNQMLIGKELNSFANGYKLYGTYFGSHSKIEKLLGDLSQSSQSKMKQIQLNMQNEIRKFEPKKQNMTIKDCMQQPLYRLFKYVLFMKDFIKRLPQWHPDYQSMNLALKTFHDINNANNEFMKAVEQDQKKEKLDALFGGAMKNTRSFIAEMQADTIYFRGKIYLFNDLVIITKINSILGTEREEKYDSLELDEFSYVAEQNDMKYFKNILILIGKQQCIHLLFAEEGSRFEVFKCLNKIIRDLRVKQEERRRVDIAKRNTKPVAKLTFTLKEEQANKLSDLFEPEFRSEILGFEVKPLSTFSNDTVYITRFMLPYYYQDQYGFLASEDGQKGDKQRKFGLKKFPSLPFNDNRYSYEEELKSAGLNKFPYLCINQRLEIHLSQLQEISSSMSSQCSQKLPKIDPITKQNNIYSKGKKKTKSYEMRKFFIEQFFNFVFRYEQLLYNPIWFIQRLRINEHLWNYTIARNEAMKYSEKHKNVTFGYNHCKVCNKGKINSMQEFEHYRTYFLQNGNHLVNRSDDRYCFNFFNLLRLRLLFFNYTCFNNLERVLTFYHYVEGRLDYCFIKHRVQSKTLKIIDVHLASIDNQSVSIKVDHETTAGEIVDEIAGSFGIKYAFDYDLLTVYNGKFRVMDRDDFLEDAIKSLGIQAEEFRPESEQGTQKSSSFFSTIKQYVNFDKSSTSGKLSSSNKIYFLKNTYLHKSMQIKSFSANPTKRKLQISKIFWAIKHGLIRLSDQHFVTICGYFYVLQIIDKIQNFTSEKLDRKIIYKILPQDRVQAFQHFGEIAKSIAIVAEKQKTTIMKFNKNPDYLYVKILDIMFQIKDYYTYYVQVDVRQLPESVSKIQIGQTLLGVNYKNVIVTKSVSENSVLAEIAIEDLTFSTSVFSIFINHRTGSYRFDTKMVYYFGEIIRKYQTIANKFPQHKS